jgi:tight adherence protein B
MGGRVSMGGAVILNKMWKSEDDLLMLGITSSIIGFLAGYALRGPITGLSGALLAFYGLPRLWAFYKERRRVQAFLSQFIRTVDAMVSVLRAGGSEYQAVEYAASVSVTPVREELQKLKEEIDANVPLAEAASHFAGRVDLIEVKVLADALKLAGEASHEATVRILERAVDFVRERFHFRQKIEASTADVRYGFMLISFFPFLFGLLMAAAIPEYRSVILSPQGRLVMGAAILMVFMGHVLVRLCLVSAEKELGI